jgi:predicted membrane channel-forming protein YqfA (hemolysin III family)
MKEYATMRHKTPAIPIALTILIGIGWLIFLLLYTLFWSTDFTFFQNIVVTVISFIVAGGFIGLVWIVWGSRWGHIF